MEEKSQKIQVVINPEILPEVERFMEEDHRPNITNAMHKLAIMGLESWRQQKPHSTPVYPQSA